MWNGVGRRWSETTTVGPTLAKNPSRVRLALRRSRRQHACVNTRAFTQTKGYHTILLFCIQSIQTLFYSLSESLAELWQFSIGIGGDIMLDWVILIDFIISVALNIGGVCCKFKIKYVFE